jgi:hypothetical protein
LTAFASNNSEVRGLEPRGKLISFYEAVESAVGSLRARIAQQVNIIGESNFLVNSKFLNRTNKACFREELPLGSFGSKKLATPESSITKFVVFQILNCVDGKLCHVVTD